MRTDMPVVYWLGASARYDKAVAGGQPNKDIYDLMIRLTSSPIPESRQSPLLTATFTL